MGLRIGYRERFFLLTGCAGVLLGITAYTRAEQPLRQPAALVNAAPPVVAAPIHAIPDPVRSSVTQASTQWGTSGTSVVSNEANLPWLGINRFSITLSEAVSLSPGDVSVTGFSVANYGPVTISGSGSSYTITLAQPINTADRVVMTIGNSQIETYTISLNVLSGDVNGDGEVNAQDLVLIRNAMSSPYNVLDDINGDGVVNITDYNMARARVGTSLPNS